MESAVLSVCIVSLAISISENLTAGTRLGKQVKFILSLILIAVIFRPFSDNISLPDIPDIPEFQQYSDEFYNNEMKMRISENISEAFEDELLKNGINTDFIDTDINISDSDSISINSVTVGTDNFQRAEMIIKENLGEETEVLNGYG